MKNIIFLFLTIFGLSTHGQEVVWRTIPSITDWIQEINDWPDSTYAVSYIELNIDPEKDSLYVDFDEKITNGKLDSFKTVINKAIIIDHARIKGYGNRMGFSHAAFKNIIFTKLVFLDHFDGLFVYFKDIEFQGQLIIRRYEGGIELQFWDCSFAKVIMNDFYKSVAVMFRRSSFSKEIFISNDDNSSPKLIIRDSKIGNGLELGNGSRLGFLSIRNCEFQKDLDLENVTILNSFYLTETSPEYIELEGSSLPSDNTYVPFNLISKNVAIEVGENIFRGDKYEDMAQSEHFDLLISSYAKLLAVYQSRSDHISYNACYTEMRDKQTMYSRYLYDQNPTFDNWLAYSLNRFLRIFSDYGTRPTKAIIFSIYVILSFALVYLFFPNHWDSHGRMRIMDRYRFFLKYLNKKEGAHEVYMEEKEKELLPFHEFRAYLEENGKTAPRFFYITALPLYKWSISGSKLSSWFLCKMDVLKGKWSEVPEKGRWIKTGLVVGAFTLALIYDLFIKILNAVMLSINTFTTLGFGEIPIKGLPRYLAIIQGFIGWFMLTIFSVSLISQLLN